MRYARSCWWTLPLLAAGCAAKTVPESRVTVTVPVSSSSSSERATPLQLAVPEGNELAFQFHAQGVQIYTCQAAADSFGWVFTAPEADLYDRQGRDKGRHYAGPTWEDEGGDSTVVGSKLAEAAVDATAIPWLLLKAKSSTGTGIMAPVTYIQRLSTMGGLAPSTPCAAANSGEVTRVRYTASYAFYTAKHK